MWKEIWNLIRQHEDLLTEAFTDAADMLALDREMFTVVVESLDQELSEEILGDIKEKDRALNVKQQEIRRKVFEHLAVSKGRDLLSGLVLTSIVIDLERIGDYAKNMGEVVQIFPGRLELGEDGKLLAELRGEIVQLFDMTRRAMVEQHEASARACLDLYGRVGKKCNVSLERIVASAKTDSAVSKTDLAMVLMLRFFKRTAAHLKNIASATVAPFPMIGYRKFENR